jgi:DNA-directed RNA polymerase specialized sigma24 family protein
MNGLSTQFITRTYQQPYRPARLQRIAKNGKTALSDSADTYKDFIWALARKFTNSPEEAKAAVQEMFADIQRCAEKGDLITSNEDRLVARIAWRRLIRFLQ